MNCWENGAARVATQLIAPGSDVEALHAALYDGGAAWSSAHAAHVDCGVDARLEVRWIAEDEDNPARGSYGLFARPAQAFAAAVGERERDGSRRWHGVGGGAPACGESDSGAGDDDGEAEAEKGEEKGEGAAARDEPAHVFSLYGTVSRDGVRTMLADLARVLGGGAARTGGGRVEAVAGAAEQRGALCASDVFYDMGSGVGNIVRHVHRATAAGRCVGIEYLEKRHAVAQARAAQALARAHRRPTVAPTGGSTPAEQGAGTREMCFRCADFAGCDISDATVVFSNTIAFDCATLLLVAAKAVAAPRLRCLITTTALPPDAPALQGLVFVLKRNVRASWGQSQLGSPGGLTSSLAAS